MSRDQKTKYYRYLIAKEDRELQRPEVIQAHRYTVPLCGLHLRIYMLVVNPNLALQSLVAIEHTC